MLPHRDIDPILRLHSHYFFNADLMHSQADKLSKEKKKVGRISNRKMYQLLHYEIIWLGFLYVVVEGFMQLKMREVILSRPHCFHDLFNNIQEIEDIVEDNIDSLRRFRNGTFHYQSNPEKQIQFFEKSDLSLSWARALHDELEKFFSRYRIHCFVTYAIEGRIEEIQK